MKRRLYVFGFAVLSGAFATCLLLSTLLDEFMLAVAAVGCFVLAIVLYGELFNMSKHNRR